MPSMSMSMGMWGQKASPPSAGGGGLGLQTNLTAFFELDNSLADSTGTITDLTNNNATKFVTDTPGATGEQCANFVSASSQYLSHADDANLDIGAADFSYSIWFKLTAFNGPVFGKETSAFPQNGYTLGNVFTSAQKARSRGAANGTGQNADSVATLSLSTWYLAVWTYNATTRIGSQSLNNSAFVNATALGVNPSSETADFRIGANVNLSTFLAGRVCRVGVWKNRLLNTTDVGLLWNGGAGLTYAAMA